MLDVLLRFCEQKMKIFKVVHNGKNYLIPDESPFLSFIQEPQSYLSRPPARAGEVVHRREEQVGNEKVFLCLLPKGTCPHSQPAQPVGGPLRAFRCEGRRPGTKAEVQRLTTSHQRRESRGKNLFPLGFFPPFLPKKWGPGWASHRSLPFQRRGRKPATPPPPQNAASKLCLYEAVFSHCQTFSLQQDAAG